MNDYEHMTPEELRQAEKENHQELDDSVTEAYLRLEKHGEKVLDTYQKTLSLGLTLNTGATGYTVIFADKVGHPIFLFIAFIFFNVGIVCCIGMHLAMVKMHETQSIKLLKDLIQRINFVEALKECNFEESDKHMIKVDKEEQERVLSGEHSFVNWKTCLPFAFFVIGSWCLVLGGAF